MSDGVMVTGATGLLGKALVRRFASGGRRVFAAVRNEAKGRAAFAGMDGVEVVRWDVVADDAPSRAVCAGVSAIVHAASETASRAFVERPVETIRSIVKGTENVLEYARKSGIGDVVYLSTMEVYGLPEKEPVRECDFGPLDPASVRSSYPEAKRLAEALCVAYAREFGLRTKIARLTQTFGDGVEYGDGRVFAEFARAVVEGRDIVLRTRGTTARCYCNLEDAADAVALILERGEAATPYTVADEESFCTIEEMARMVAEKFGGGRTKVVFDLEDASKSVFAPPFRMRLDSSRLRALGWRPARSLEETFAQTIDCMRRAAARTAPDMAESGGAPDAATSGKTVSDSGHKEKR